MARTDLPQVHRDALAVASSYVERVGSADLERPTPCAAWDLRLLLGHMVGQHLGFATVARDGAAPSDAYRPVPFSPESWRTSVAEMSGAFAGADLDPRVV